IRVRQKSTAPWTPPGINLGSGSRPMQSSESRSRDAARSLSKYVTANNSSSLCHLWRADLSIEPPRGEEPKRRGNLGGVGKQDFRQPSCMAKSVIGFYLRKSLFLDISERHPTLAAVDPFWPGSRTSYYAARAASRASQQSEISADRPQQDKQDQEQGDSA